MPKKSLPTRLAAVLALLLTAGALSTPVASARPSDASPGDAYVLTVGTELAGTDYDNRRVDVIGTVTKADGTPAPGVPVTLEEVVRFTTWNPWGDPIDPNYYESRELGTPVSDADGRFTVRDVTIDHVGDSSLLNVQHEVQITAFHDEDGDPNTPQDGYYADTSVAIGTRPSSVDYTVNRKRVKAGDFLVVQGKVTLPAGVGPGNTEVFLQTFWESQYETRTTTKDDGSFMLIARVEGYDNTFRLRTAPRDLYVAGAYEILPVTNVSHARP